MKYKLALVKQDLFADLYYCNVDDDMPYQHSVQRSGPMGLFKAFDTDFYIVSSDESEGYWREKIDCCGHKSYQGWQDVRSRPLSYFDKDVTQRQLSTPIEDIDFSSYDIVIALDACLGKDIISDFPNVLWAYYITEPCMQSYKDSLQSCIGGYDVFLNQLFRPNDHPEYKLNDDSHQIDFPYAFVYPGLFKELFYFPRVESLNDDRPLNVVLPSYVRRQLSSVQEGALKKKFNLLTPAGGIKQFLKILNSADVYLRLGEQAKFGNETAEAVCSDLLFLSTTRGWKNRVFNLEGTTIPGVSLDDAQFEFAMDRMSYLDKNRDELIELRRKQAEIAKELCYERPLSILEKKIRGKKDV